MATLLAGHALADGPLQSRRLSAAKHGDTGAGSLSRPQALALHAGCHGLVVAAVTRNPALGVAEWVAHAVTDDLKCRGRLTTAQDQAIHVACKLAWAIVATRAD